MKHQGTVELETDRLFLRRLSEADANEMFKNWANDDEVTRHLSWPSHKSVEDSKKIIYLWLYNYYFLNFYQWGIVDKASGKLIGTISCFNGDDDNETMEVGYVLAKDKWHQGLMTEAFNKMSSFMFKEVRLKKLIARNDHTNEINKGLLEKVGFVYEKQLVDKNNKGESIVVDVYTLKSNL